MAMTRLRKTILAALGLSLVLVGGLVAYLDHSLRNIDLSGVVVYKEGVGPAYDEVMN